MKYIIKQKLIAFGDDFNIQDEHGHDAYFVDGRAFSFGKRLSFQDTGGTELAEIRQKLFTFAPTYHIKNNGDIVGTLKKALLSFRPKFSLDVPGPHDYTIVGDFLGHEYTIERGRHKVARVSKKFFSITDSYGVEIEGGDHVMILCAVIVIDLALHSGKKK